MSIAHLPILCSNDLLFMNHDLHINIFFCAFSPPLTSSPLVIIIRYDCHFGCSVCVCIVGVLLLICYAKDVDAKWQSVKSVHCEVKSTD